jgi:dTMP kinase
VVYQGYGGGLDPELLWTIGRLVTGGLEPDLTVVLDLPIESAGARRKERPDRFESRDLTFQTRVRDGFLAEARRRPERIRVVDARPSMETVHARICAEVLRVLEPHPRT